MLLRWALIMSVTLVSVTMLMVLSAYLAILEEAVEYFQQNRSKILIFTNIFNLSYIILSPLFFNAFNKNYFKFVIASSIATGIGAVGRYLAGNNYNLALFMTGIIGISHIPIITAPYGLLKLFPDHQKGYAASIPLFLPTLGINFCILFGMIYIANSGEIRVPWNQKVSYIELLNLIIAIIGATAAVLTVGLMFKLRPLIDQQQKQQKTVIYNSFLQRIQAFVTNLFKKTIQHKLTILLIVCWGAIVGVNWSIGSLFSIIFGGQGLSEKDVALIGLAANLSSAILSNLGAFIHNRFKLTAYRIISILNLFGLAAAFLLFYSKHVPLLQNLYILIFLMIILRAGFSSFVSLAFLQMQKSGIPSVIISGAFFWIANVFDYIGLQLIDKVYIDITVMIEAMIISLCIHFASQRYVKNAQNALF